MHAPATRLAAPDRMTTGEHASCSGVAGETIRFSEDEGLLRDVERSPAGYRLFDPGHLRRLRVLQDLSTIPEQNDRILRLLEQRADSPN